MYYNLLIIGGNLCADIKSREVGTTVVANFSIATSRVTKDKKETTFIDCEAWGKTAENITKYFGKGSPILVTGRLKSDIWQTQSGEKRQKLVMVVERFDFVMGPNEKPAEGAADPAPVPAPALAKWTDTAVDNEPPF